ncbi:hypothetical protein [Winogradskya humida]|uniref:Uncharacterized protein n=1 Tax=Winogradskya humida TaxID=113566 RepID=A0ABQ4A1R1_9ACTN|nr:hypothetical protein [Actinoplanes humidus]GIE24797.1 hypothetical protein Ahu01nite_078990 [Actinoplanes humidus]
MNLVHNDGHLTAFGPAGATALRLYAGMLAACDRTGERDALLADAETLPQRRSSTASDTPVGAGLIVDAPEDHQHVCVCRPYISHGDLP